MIRQMSLLLAGLAVLAGGPAGAQDAGPGARYQMQPVEGGVVRLDTSTGTIDFCRVEAATVTCDAAAGAADTSRLDALEARVEALEQGSRALVDRDDADYAVDQMRKLFSGFADIVKDLERDLGRDAPEETLPPDRT